MSQSSIIALKRATSVHNEVDTGEASRVGWCAVTVTSDLVAPVTLAELLRDEGVVGVVGRLLQTHVHRDVEDLTLLLVSQTEPQQLLKGIHVVLADQGQHKVITRS